MTHIVITSFGGEIPRLTDHLLPDGKATLAQNMKLSSGGVRPWHKPSISFSPVRSAVASFYRMPYSVSDVWLTWTEDVHAIPGAVANDTDYKTYFTGQATPRKTNYNLATNTGTTTECPNDYLELGVPAPTAAMALAVVGGAATNVTRAYVQTYVTSWGEESKPGPAVTVTGHPDGSWNLSAIPAAPAGKYSITLSNIYRTLTDSYGNTNYQLVAQQSVATSTYSDVILDGALGAICPSLTYDVPPTDLKNLIAMPNGVMAGISASTKQVCFCEPYKPHAWPQAYRYAVEYTPISIGAIGDSVIVGTAGAPYIMSGSHPSTMSSVKLPTVQPCISERSMFSLGFGVVYSTPDGFVLSLPGNTDLASREWFSRDEWQALNPSTIKSCKYDDCLFMFYKLADNVTYGGKFIDKKLDEMGSLNNPVDFAYSDPFNGNLYLLQQNVIIQWNGNGGDYLQADWKSKRLITAKPVNFGVAQVDADWNTVLSSTLTNAGITAFNQTIAGDAGGEFNVWQFNQTGSNLFRGTTFNGGLMLDLTPNSVAQYVQFTLWVNGVVKFTKAVSSSAPFRLPSGYKSTDYNVELSGTIPMNFVKVAETARELATV